MLVCQPLERVHFFGMISFVEMKALDGASSQLAAEKMVTFLDDVVRMVIDQTRLEDSGALHQSLKAVVVLVA